MTFLAIVTQNFPKVQLQKNEALKTLQSSLGSMVDKFKTLNQRLTGGSLTGRALPVSELSDTQEHLIQVGKLVTLASRVFREQQAFKEGFRKSLAQVPSEEQPDENEFEKSIQSDPTVQSLEMVYRELLAMRHIQESLFHLKCDKKESELERDQLSTRFDEVEHLLKSTLKVDARDAILNVAVPQQQKFGELVQKINQLKDQQDQSLTEGKIDAVDPQTIQQLERELERLMNQAVPVTHEQLAEVRLTGFESPQFRAQVESAKQLKKQASQLQSQLDQVKAKVADLGQQISENLAYWKFFDQNKVAQLENHFPKTFEMSEIVQKIFE